MKRVPYSARRVWAAALVSLLLVACTSSADPVPTSEPIAAVATSVPATSVPTTSIPTIEPTAVPPLTATAAVPQFVEIECPYITIAYVTGRCGTVDVPADHNNPAAGTLSLFVFVATPTTPGHLTDPLFVFEERAGDNLLYADYMVRNIWLNMLPTRDYVFVEQRGTRTLQPALACPELDALIRAQLSEAHTEDEVYAARLEAITTCRDRAQAEGVDLSLLTVWQTAADIDYVRQALGYDQINLYSMGYGGLLAQAVLALPGAEGWVRSAILDSPVAPGVPLATGRATGMQYSLARINEQCAADPACFETFGDLFEDYAAALPVVEQNPPSFTTQDGTTGQSLDVLANGMHFRDGVYSALSDSRLAPYIPATIVGSMRGAPQALRDFRMWTTVVYYELSPVGLARLAAECSYAPRESAAAVAALGATLDPLFAVTPAAWQYANAVCDVLGIEPDPWAATLVTSPVPVLVMTGEYDALSSPPDTQRIADNLGNAIYLEFPQGSRTALFSAISSVRECATDILVAFVDDPSMWPDVACVDAIEPTTFAVPRWLNQ